MAQKDDATSEPARDGADDEPVTLPPNVSVSNGKSGTQLSTASIFTRLETTVRDAEQLKAALSADLAPFCIQHHHILLVFDADQESHHEHFRQVCLRLSEHDLGLQYGCCVFDVPTALAAGFQFDILSDGAVLLVDLQYQEDSSSGDESEGESDQV